MPGPPKVPLDHTDQTGRDDPPDNGRNSASPSPGDSPMSVATASSLTRASSPSSISPASAVFSCGNNHRNSESSREEVLATAG